MRRVKDDMHKIIRKIKTKTIITTTTATTRTTSTTKTFDLSFMIEDNANTATCLNIFFFFVQDFKDIFKKTTATATTTTTDS